MSLLVLSASDVDQVISYLTPNELQILMARVFSSPASYTPHRTSIPTTNHTALFMPARIVAGSGLHGTTIKVVCVPQDPADSRGLPGSTLVLDEATGAVKAIVNARSLTPLRNAAGSLLSTNLTGLPSPESIVAFGAGKQIEAHLDLHLKRYRSIHTCMIVNRTLNSRVEALKQRMESRFPARSFQWIASSPHNRGHDEDKLRNAVSNTSLIICATSSTSPLFPSSWVRGSTHVILIGSYTPAMREVDRDLVQRAILKPGERDATPRLFVDSRMACAAEAGELIEAGVTGSQVAEIGELVKFTEAGELEVSEREMGDDAWDVGSGPITMFKSVGVGSQDVAIACAVVAKAEEIGVGTRIPGYDC